jgi:heat shock protein HtpX
VGKRVLLFVLTNLVMVLTISVVLGLLGVGRGTGGLGGLAIWALAWGMVGSFVSLAMSRWVAKFSLGVKLVDGRTGHRELDWLHATVERLAGQAGLPMPEVGVYDSPEVNAFATGPTRSRSLVAVSSGLLHAMDHAEVEGVLAHEVAHVANGDMVTMALIQGVVNAFVLFLARIAGWIASSAIKDERLARFVDFGVYMVAQLAFGLLGLLVTSAFSRRREFRADAGGAELAGREKMTAALRKLQRTHELIDPGTPALASFKIAGVPKSLLSTHPPLEDRIEALRAGR